MTLTTLLIYIAIAAVILSVFMILALKVHKNIVTTYLQNFTGILFLFSGWVKAVDPLGTAFKMEDYFAEFNTTFADTSMSFIAPLFPFLSEYSVTFAVVMIIFEMILGMMLIMGDRPKLTSWAFFLLVAFFTFLTGFTYLTGYVPSDANFFDFSAWSEYKVTNMRVTDCGCFGDFILLEPRISFYKDIFLLIPAIYFLVWNKSFHQVFTTKSRNTILGASILILALYCIYNFYWNEPQVDFRPFRNNTNIATIKKQEMDAAAAVKVTDYVLKDKVTGEIKKVPYAEYLKDLTNIQEKYDAIDQIRTEPAIKETKISHFDITDFDGNERTEVFLANENPVFMVLIYHPEYTAKSRIATVQDTSYLIDTTQVVGFKDSTLVVKSIDKISSREVTVYDIVWDQHFIDVFTDKLKPILDAGNKDGIKSTVVISGIDAEKATSLGRATGIDVEFLTADEKLLKTIMRSNPGLILWKNGVLLHKWHYKKLPTYEEIKSTYLDK